MINYNDGKWHAFDDYTNGVHDKSIVKVITDTGDVSVTEMEYSRLTWYTIGEGSNGNPVAFLVVKEHKQPREFWLDIVSGEIHYNLIASSSGTRFVHVREVLS